MASTSEAQDAVIDEILGAADVAPGRVVALDEAGAARALRLAALPPRPARPRRRHRQPARLALGLRGRLLERGVAIHERSRVRALA